MKRPTSRFLIVAYVAAVVVAVVFLARLPFGIHQQTPDDGPLIQDVSTEGFSVVWWQEGDGEGVLRLRGSGIGDSQFVAARHGNRYEARAGNLDSGTAYRYEILHTGTHGSQRRLCAGRAATAKPPGAAFAFIVFADSGSGKRSQYHLARVMDDYSADLILHAGDLVYRKGELGDYHKKFFRPYRDLLSRAPFYPVLGNHDVRTDNGKPFLDTFSLPTNGPPSVQAERCYWFDYGDARFVGVDSTLDRETLSEAVAPWLQAVLKAPHAKWKFVYFHHPPGAGGNRPADAKVRETLVPAIEAAYVDVVFCGHNHLYERTHPMLQGKTAPSNGVIYVTSGAGGKSLYEEHHGDAPYLAAFNDATYSFTWVNINGSRLELMQISEDDSILDKIILSKDERNGVRVVEDE